LFPLRPVSGELAATEYLDTKKARCLHAATGLDGTLDRWREGDLLPNRQTLQMFRQIPAQNTSEFDGAFPRPKPQLAASLDERARGIAACKLDEPLVRVGRYPGACQQRSGIRDEADELQMREGV